MWRLHALKISLFLKKVFFSCAFRSCVGFNVLYILCIFTYLKYFRNNWIFYAFLIRGNTSCSVCNVSLKNDWETCKRLPLVTLFSSIFSQSGSARRLNVFFILGSWRRAADLLTKLNSQFYFDLQTLPFFHLTFIIRFLHVENNSNHHEFISPYKKED
jgi:hypothetical protein